MKFLLILNIESNLNNICQFSFFSIYTYISHLFFFCGHFGHFFLNGIFNVYIFGLHFNQRNIEIRYNEFEGFLFPVYFII